MEIHSSLHKEQFSRAYVRAIAAASGYSVYEPNVDHESVDIGISSGALGLFRSPRLELQVKCSASVISGNKIAFELKRKNYDDLRHTNLLVPRILVVVIVPDDIAEWTEHTEEGLILRRCGYWVSLFGLPEVDNKRSVTVYLPRQQRFDSLKLHQMMSAIASGGHP